MSPARFRWLGHAIAALALATPAAAIAQNLSDPPHAAICTTLPDGRLVVDKDRLARLWMAKFPINIASIPANDLKTFDTARLGAEVIADQKLCKATGSCSASDLNNLSLIRGLSRSLLDQDARHRMPGYTPTDSVSYAVFFQTPNDQHAVLCSPAGVQDAAQAAAPSQTAAGAAGAAPPSPEEVAAQAFIQRFRVRASPDQLGVSRDDGADFQGTQAATLSLLRDDIAKTNTYKISGTVGFMLFDTAPFSSGLGLKILPFIDVNRTAVTAFTGPSKPASLDTVDTGVFATDFLRREDGFPLPATLSVRPDYLWNHVDGSELASLNLKFVPYVNGFINDYSFIGTKFVAVEPVADLRVDTGWYTKVALKPQVGVDDDYVRIGGQGGINIVSENPNVPLSLSSTYTALYAASGRVNIGYFSNSITWSLDPKKYVGVSLSYVDGRREDTGVREDQTTLSLSVKY